MTVTQTRPAQPSDAGQTVAGQPGGQTTSGAPRILDSRDLLAGRKEIVIRHGTEDYRLRLTGLNKLILTK
ncbi:hemin uptake protein HemP [Arenibaculum pallidiluteum]|uniref:hemin uptake protein HemP n=1 Tax=Arenibaculum pallidiluteum TaxID=2812559 RepID=UPI001A968CA4|nr:hemin uptake protein HemP [Arenibaculum pallidiluteum]